MSQPLSLLRTSPKKTGGLFPETSRLGCMTTNTFENRPGITCALAETPEHRNQVYQLRYTCYRRKDSIDPRPDAKFSDDYDLLPNHFSFLTRSCSGESLATVRVSVVRPDLGWTTAPSQKVFGDHPAFQRMARGSYVEASRLCFGEQARRDALLQVVSFLAALADFYEVDWLVACPREEHSHLYERLFGFVRLAEPRQYFGVRFRTSLLGVTREQLHQYTQDSRCMNTAVTNASAYLINAASSPAERGNRSFLAPPFLDVRAGLAPSQESCSEESNYTLRPTNRMGLASRQVGVGDRSLCHSSVL